MRTRKERGDQEKKRRRDESVEREIEMREDAGERNEEPEEGSKKRK